MTKEDLFSVNSYLFLATLACFAWGFGYGWWLHKARTGQIFERQYTWLATVVGIGVDLFILAVITNIIPWEFVSVLCASAIGIIVMALVYGYPVIDNSSFKPKWLLEECVALTLDCYEATVDLFKHELPDQAIDDIKTLLATQDKLRETLKEARKSIVKKRKAKQ